MAILSTPWVFYLTCAILVALGPLTHLALVMLQKIMVAEDKKGEGMFTVHLQIFITHNTRGGFLGNEKHFTTSFFWQVMLEGRRTISPPSKNIFPTRWRLGEEAGDEG